MKLHIEYWKQSAENDWKTSNILFKAKRYDACLFFCHLAIEKSLKGLVVRKTKTQAPYTHNLEKLASIAQLDLSEKQIKHLRTVASFNIAGRYPDEKTVFYKQITKRYCEHWLKNSDELFLWLKKEYQN